MTSRLGVPSSTAVMALLLLVLCQLIVQLTAQGTYPRPYCQWEIFNASCTPDEVIVMESARYGRMRAGRCAKTGTFGCSADVLPFADSKCSGKRRCSILVADIALQGFQPCPGDYTAYFEAAYRCHAVEHFQDNVCQTEGAMELDATAGFISSTSAQKAGYLSRCPWALTAGPGQRINITLYDFGRYSGDSGAGGSTVCPRYAIIREGKGRETNICAGRDRVRNVYISDTNSVQLLLTNKPSAEEAHFLFHYQAVGCDSPLVPSVMQVTRQDNTADVYCNITDTRWTLRCESGHWVGKVGNCSKGVNEDLWHVLSHKWTSPYGLLLVIGLGVVLGVVIGTTLLAVALCWMKRSRRLHRPDDVDKYMGGSLSPDGGQGDVSFSPDTKNGYYVGQSTNGDYSDVWGLQRLVPGYAHGGDKTASSGYQTMSVESSMRPESVCSAGGTSSRSNNHVYESPKFQRKDMMPRSTS